MKHLGREMKKIKIIPCYEVFYLMTHSSSSPVGNTNAMRSLHRFKIHRQGRLQLFWGPYAKPERPDFDFILEMYLSFIVENKIQTNMQIINKKNNKMSVHKEKISNNVFNKSQK